LRYEYFTIHHGKWMWWLREPRGTVVAKAHKAAQAALRAKLK